MEVMGYLATTLRYRREDHAFVSHRQGAAVILLEDAQAEGEHGTRGKDERM
jgi:hypothetical protein